MPDTLFRPRLLVVEPHDAVRRILGRWLQSRFEIAPIAKGAMGRLREERFDIMLLDLGTGDPAFEVLKAAKMSDPNLPVIATSAAFQHEAPALALGALVFIAKPYDARTLDAALTRAVSAARSRRVV